MNRWLMVAMAVWFQSSAAWAQDGFDDAGFGDSGFGDGFDTEVSAPVVELDAVDTNSVVQPWSFYGFMKGEAGYSPQKEGDEKKLTKLQGTLNLSFDYRLNDQWRSKVSTNGFVNQAYQINGRSGYTQGTLDVYEQEFELRDTYIEGSFSSGLSVKTGRQVLAWGQSDSSQINDMANPRDNREMGMVDIEDARIPVAATKLAWVNDGLELDLVALHEFRPNKTPGAGSEFDLLGSLRSQGVVVNPDDQPTGQDGFMVRLYQSYNGGDAVVYYADTYSDGFYLDLSSVAMVGGKPALSMTPRYKKVKSVGLSGNKVFGGLLLKGELAQKQGMVYGRNDLATQVGGLLQQGVFPGAVSGQVISFEEKDVTQVMAGVEYMGFVDLTLTMEVTYEKINDWQDTLSSKETGGVSFSSVDYAALNDTLHTRFIWFQLFNLDGGVYRVNVDYDWMDGVNVSGGYISYQSPGPTSLLEAYAKNDRVIAALKYSF